MISIIVPALEEESTIGPALAALKSEVDPAGHEVLVVDGGSADRTIDVARAGGARTLVAARGRGAQMNAGARVARGEILLFLHADARLPPGALARVETALADPGVAGGGFCKRYDRGGWILGGVAQAQNLLRTRIGRQLVGTQALFVRRVLFERLGGFREWPLLEDVDFSDRLRRAGRVAVIGDPVVVSARRYQARGALRQTAVNVLILALFRLGASPERLARLYAIVR